MRPKFSVIPLPGIFPEEIIRKADIDLCTKTFIAELFIVENRKQPKCPTETDQWAGPNIIPHYFNDILKMLIINLIF